MKKQSPAKTEAVVETTSDKIRKMHAAGMSIPAIRKELGICYAFAYQVIQRDRLAQGLPMDTQTPHEEPKTAQMRAMYDQGMTKGQIAKALNANYGFVWRTLKDYESRKGL